MSGENMMKTAVIEEPGRIDIRELPMPEPGEYGALCKMLYGATCTGTDGHLIRGKIPWPVYYPTAFGHESVGRVVEVGKKVRNYKIGDIITRVGLRESDCKKAGLNWNWGGYSTHGVATDHRAMKDDGLSEAEYGAFRVNQVVPPEIDPRDATLIITWRETLSFATRMGVCKGASVLVLGSGGNGLSFVSMSKALGASYVAAVGGAGREPNARRAGVDAYFDYRSGDWAGALSSGEKFDFIIDAVAAPDGLGKVLSCLKPGGACGIYGLEIKGADPVLIAPLASHGFIFYAGGYDEEETHDRVIELILRDALDASAWLEKDREFGLDEIKSAFAALNEKRFVKALIKL